MSESNAEYLTVAEAAARLGISTRAVQKRCANGSITAQRIGGQWQVLALDAMRTGELQNEHQGANRTGGERTGSHSKRTEPANERTIGREPNRELANQNELQNEPAAAALLAQSREEVLFLRGLIEQRDRDAAELRAALRKALEAMPKAITEGAKLEQVGTEKSEPIEAAQSVQSTPDGQAGGEAKQSPQRGAQAKSLTAWQRVAARILGIR
jgi:excisionase family DNA binding protein